MDYRSYFKQYPYKNGRYGEYGGAILPPELVPVFKEITEAYNAICHSARSSRTPPHPEGISGASDSCLSLRPAFTQAEDGVPDLSQARGFESYRRS